MKQTTKKRIQTKSDLLPEYDFSKGIRGKYAKRFQAGSNVVVLAPDLIKFFPNSEAVNEALHALVNIMEKKKKLSA